VDELVSSFAFKFKLRRYNQAENQKQLSMLGKAVQLKTS